MPRFEIKKTRGGRLYVEGPGPDLGLERLSTFLWGCDTVKAVDTLQEELDGVLSRRQARGGLGIGFHAVQIFPHRVELIDDVAPGRFETSVMPLADFREVFAAWRRAVHAEARREG